MSGRYSIKKATGYGVIPPIKLVLLSMLTPSRLIRDFVACRGCSLQNVRPGDVDRCDNVWYEGEWRGAYAPADPQQSRCLELLLANADALRNARELQLDLDPNAQGIRFPIVWSGSSAFVFRPFEALRSKDRAHKHYYNYVF